MTILFTIVEACEQMKGQPVERRNKRTEKRAFKRILPSRLKQE